MSRRKKRPRAKLASKKGSHVTAAGPQVRRTQDGQGTEKRAADAITVAWMMTTLATFAAELLACSGWLFFAYAVRADDWPNQFLALPGLLHFSAVVTGCLAFLLAVIVNRVRVDPIPPSVTYWSVAIALWPIATSVVRLVQNF